MLYAVLGSGRILVYPEGPTYPAWTCDGTDGRPSDIALVAQEQRTTDTLEERTRPVSVDLMHPLADERDRVPRIARSVLIGQRTLVRR